MPAPPHPVRPPFSMRHAFALAFDLAIRRDPLHSLVVPWLLRAPWMVSFALMMRGDDFEASARHRLFEAIALLGQSVTWWTVDAMLRFRARSVFNTPADAKPAPAIECYARALRRLPWLYVTEFVRNTALTFGFGFFILPGVFLSYRLGFATEAVVLDEPDLTAAFRRSFQLSHGRFERWLEMIAASTALALAVLFMTVAEYLIFTTGAWWAWLLAGSLVAAAIWPIIQYAWTFFYLRLVEVEAPRGDRARRGVDRGAGSAAAGGPAGGPVDRNDPGVTV